MLKRVPLNRLLLETDSPYLTPVPMRGRPNSPENVFYTYSCAAEVLNLSLDSLKERVIENFRELCSR
jgi:TatD DNase family protein